MKYDYKGVLPESKINSKWKKVGDTNLGHVDIGDFKKQMYGLDGRLPSTIASKMMHNKIVEGTCFPLAIQCNELIVECARHCDPQERQIWALDGRVLTYLKEVAIKEFFLDS